jgi:CHAT domain-containing protein/tetratricopeptide (TPR) repeat protein
MRSGRPALLFLVVLSLAAPAALGGTGEEAEVLLPGQVREGPIAAGEAHVFQVDVPDAPLLITVQQQGVDLVIDAQGPMGRAILDARHLRWGPEVLLLETTGEYRIEIRPRDPSVPPGSYTIEADLLTPSEDRSAALALMSHAGQEAFEKTPEARRRALATFRAALAAWRSLGDRRWEADCLDAIGVLEAEERELRPAADDYSRALALWRELGDPHREAATLNELGLTRSYIGNAAAAREALQGAVTLWQRLGEPFDEGLSQGNLCFLDLTGGALPAALACYEENRAFFRDLGDKRLEAQILNSLGGIHDLQGEPEAALNSYEQSLALRRSLGDRLEEARILNNLGVSRRPLGEWQESLRLYGQALEILEPIGDRLLEGALLNNIGFTYDSLGEPQRARLFLEDALKMRRDIHDGPGEISTLNNLGRVWQNLGEPDKALDFHRQALERATALGNRRLEAASRLGLGEVQLARGDANAALRDLEPALGAFKDTGLHRREARTLQLRGRALALAGRPREALPVLQDVLARCRNLHDGAGEAEALQELATAESSLGLAAEAHGHAEQAVARVEELRRTGFVSPDLRAAFMATQRRAYSLLIDSLMDRQADRAALEASERARARSLLDVLFSGGAGQAGSAVPAALVERRHSLRLRLSAKADQQLKQSGEKADGLGREMGTLLTELDGVEAEIRRLDPRYAAVSAPPILGVEEISKLLDPGTLLLEYSLGEDRSFLWAVGNGSFRSFELPPEREIEKLARRFYEELSTVEVGSGRRQDTATSLSRILLSPVWPEGAQYRRLVVVPDGSLHLIPFGALPVPGSGKPLLEQLEIAYLPSATTLALQRQRLERRPPATKWAAVLADPVFAANDQRLVRPSGAGNRVAVFSPPQAAALSRSERGPVERAPLADLARLPASRREAEEIAALAPGKVWSGLDLAANREAVLSGGLRGYRVVHFATHAVADTSNPELSGLVLSLVDAAGKPREGFLGLSDIYDLDLDADLVVLSGCRTALGKEVRGEGIMGLTRGFLYAGVPRVVASLWKVQDRTTAELMSRFYRALWRDHLPPAAALRQAQMSLRRDPHYRDPYSWAGFVLQGDWR